MPIASGRGFLRFREAVHAAQPARRAVHIEVGANNGAWSGSAFAQLCMTKPPIWTPPPAGEQHLFILVEAQAQFAQKLRALAANASAASRGACRVDFLAVAAWTYEGTVSFSSTRDHRGAHVGDQSTMRTMSRTSVPCIDFGSYLRRTLKPSDLVFMKVDVEVGEFTVLPKWLAQGALCGIDFMLIEWHFSSLREGMRLGALGLRLGLSHMLDKACDPRPPFLSRGKGRNATMIETWPARRYIQHYELQLSRHIAINGLWERARWHNGRPPLDATGNMAWSRPGTIMSQESVAAEWATATAGRDEQGDVAAPVAPSPPPSSSSAAAASASSSSSSSSRPFGERSLPTCGFHLQARDGSWDWSESPGRVRFEPSNCHPRRIRASALATCLRHKTLTFLGDSTVRDFARAVANVIDLMPISGPPPAGMAASPSPPYISLTQGLPAWQRFRPSLGKALVGPSPFKDHAGTRGQWTHEGLNVTVVSISDVQTASSWDEIRRVVQAARGARSLTDSFMLLQLGIHDTTSLCGPNGRSLNKAEACSKLVGTQRALQWKAEPRLFVESPVFRPFLDYWCRVRSLPAADAALWPSLVWMTANEQCVEKKPRKWRYQATLMHSANVGVAEASAAAGTPLLDLASIARPHEMACNLSLDGVHQHQHTEHVRAALLLSYLCDDDGQWRLGKDAWPPFNATAAGCKSPAD